MKKKMLFALGLCGQMLCFAQTDLAAKYANTITGTDLKKHLTIIASDAMEGRETGTLGQRKAAAYIESQFKQMGLNSVAALKGYQQFYPLYQDSISSDLKWNNQSAIYGVDFISNVVNNSTFYNSSSNQTELESIFSAKEWVFVGYGIDDKNYNDYDNLDVKGKLVVFFAGEPKANGIYLLSGTKRGSKWSYPGISAKVAAAQAKGAVGALVINPSQEKFVQPAIDNSRKSKVYFPQENATKTVNYAIISAAFAQKIIGNSFDTLLKQAKAATPIAAQWKSSGKAAVTFASKKTRVTIMASNVVGIVEGSDKKDEYVFCTGHYDHLGKHDGKIYYGADDDGSGTCGVIEMAEAFAKAKAEGHGPRRTMVFMTVSGEEKGLWGSEYYSDHPFFPLDKTTVDLNTDMVGRVDTERKLGDTLNYVYVIGHNKLSTDLPIINEGNNNKYTKLTLDYKFDDPADTERIYYRSDHYNFARKGIPVLFFYDGMLLADYHKPTDTVEKINFELYEKRVKMIFYTAWDIANRDEMLKRDIPLDEGTR